MTGGYVIVVDVYMTHQHLAGHEPYPELTLVNVDYSF